MSKLSIEDMGYTTRERLDLQTSYTTTLGAISSPTTKI
jgi:hypothetical protein